MGQDSRPAASKTATLSQQVEVRLKMLPKNNSRREARRAAPAVLACALALALAACSGDDDDGTYLPIAASADTFTLAAGQNGQVLGNDTLGGAAAVAGAGGNVVFSLAISAMPAGFSVVNGLITVFPGAMPGTYTFPYNICEAANTGNCANANATVTVPAPPIVAMADTANLALGGSADVLANDTLGGAPATAATVMVTATTSPMPAGITLSAGGVLAVDTTAVAGNSVINYRICQTVAPANCATAAANVTVTAAGMITGRAIDSATAQGVAGVRVGAGGRSTTTDATGAFRLDGVGTGSRLSVVFSSDTHAETARIASVAATGSTDVQARLVRIGTTADVAVDTGGTVTLTGSPARVVLAPASVQRADGSIPTGNVTVRLTPINPASDTAVMPGDFTTVVGGVSTPIESFGAMEVRLTDSAGAALNLRAGQTAALRIPLASRAALPPATIPLFHFDSAAGRWVQEGTATLAGTGANRYYEGTVSHFTVWNADQVMNTVRVSGCVADALGVRVAGALVASDGIDYSGSSTITTDANGNFTIPIRLNSTATLVGLSNGLLTNTLSAGPYAADTQLTNCLALGQTGAGVTMKLTWGAAPGDLDSHLYTPSGAHVYFSRKGNLLAEPFANLDVDDTDSFGPEVITLTRLMVGTYKYYVNNYSGFSSGSFTNATARVELNVPGRSAELFTPPTVDEPGSTRVWTLFELDIDAQCNVTVRRVPGFSASAPTQPATSTPQYCTRP
jgi:uncharacterized protein YfaP (DUF2135 family)